MLVCGNWWPLEKAEAPALPLAPNPERATLILTRPPTNGCRPRHSLTRSRFTCWADGVSLVESKRHAGSSPQNPAFLRATSHVSQEPWPWNGEDPWLSHPKAVPWVCWESRFMSSQALKHSVKWEWNMVQGPLHSLVAEKEGRIWFNMICLKLY